ncbi:hypothetical protein, conserved [Leishmania tarentolae]|uniref:Uncharacterized protein n=1 Tax=Leishmania tarentolae TaxID=5689 RepID=A0A640KLD9_LEITA|nr:hypothetical protein, conserved [Leishmania tarentolae]
MSRATLPRRPHSSAPGEANCADVPVLPNARHAPSRRTTLACSSLSAYFPTQASLFRDSYGLPVTCAPASNGRSYQPPQRRQHAYANGGSRDVGPRYHDVTCNPGARRPPPPPRRAVTAGASPGQSRTTNGNGTADAVVFQYYSQQRQRRGQRRSESSLHEFEAAATPVHRESCTLSGGGSSKPGTPAGGGVEASSPPPPSHCTSRPPAHDRDAAIHTRLRRQPSASPSCMEQESAIHDTSTWLIPLMPPVDEGSCWPMQLSPSQHQQCEAMVRLLAQLPPAQAYRVLLAVIHQYEAQRLLQYYGGVHVLPRTGRSQRAMSPTPSTSSLTSSPKIPSARQHDDGRPALLEALRARLDDMQRADRAAQVLSPFTEPSGHWQRRRGSRTHTPASGQSRANHFIKAHPPTMPPTTAARRPYLACRQTLPDSAIEESPGSGDCRAPRQLRSRVLASRVAKPRTRSTEQGGRKDKNSAAVRDAPASSKNCSTPPPLKQHDFMKTIKPPHRHGLAAALLTEPGASAEPLLTAHNHDSSGCTTMPPDAQITEAAGCGRAAGERDLHTPASTAELKGGSLPPPLLAFTVAGTEVSDVSVDWPFAKGTVLSPGAAAARRVYLEQQQRQRPPCHSRLNGNADDGEECEMLRELAWHSHATHDESDAACCGSNSGKCSAYSPGSVPLEEAAHGSEGLRGSSRWSVTPAGLTDVLAVPLPPKEIPGVQLPTRRASVGSSDEPAAFITDFTGASTLGLFASKAQSHSSKGNDDAGMPDAPPSNMGAFWEEDDAAAEAGGSSELHRQKRRHESHSNSNCSTPSLQGKCAEGSDRQHLLLSPAQLDESIITASSIRSEPFLQAQAADNNCDDIAVLKALPVSGSVVAGSHVANEISDEVLLPWEI